MRLVLVGEECQNNKELKTAIKLETVFVLSSFEGEVYHKLLKAETRIVGPPVIIQCSKDKKTLPSHSRPLYSPAMCGVIVCFTGFHRREEVTPLADIVHHLGGSVRKDISPKVTHLVANCTDGQKYRFAVSFGTPIMSADWIYRIWAERNVISIKATDEKFMHHRVPPFFNCCLSFIGFSDEEKKHMEELTIENGGMFAPMGDEECSHLVIDDQNVKEMPTNMLLPPQVVRGEWFWGSIQMEACADESLYEFQQVENSSTSATSIFTPGRSMSGSKSRKRKRIRENIALLAAEHDVDSPMRKRSSTEMGSVSMSPNSFLDASNTPDKSDIENIDVSRDKSHISVKISPRLQVVTELLQTEKNYVNILHTILNVFKSEIEKPNQYNGAILGPQETKLIFGNIPPIYDVHLKIRDELTDIVENWSENRLVGDTITKHADALLKAYPPFVNFFEQTKEMIAKCDKTNSRFHAFLKVCLLKPECGRQNLTELLIRPVQRLPSVSLLLNDILKHTSKENPDYVKIEKAVSVLKELCKRRIKYINSLKSPANLKTPQKAYKHLSMIPLNTVKRVLNFVDTEDCKNAFGVICSGNTETRDRYNVHSFMADSDECTKKEFITIIGKRVSRAFSFNKTPSRLKRAVSHVFSPFASNSQLHTPGDLRGKRLASCMDLTESVSPTNSFASTMMLDDSDTISLGAYSLKDQLD
ncbi:hypothetical protein KUTeg_012694 [Tegillarca granosa]|uniref:Protein ECT2 n=1 Tax=Tegillarca granosa TaxID=220873 RepID=A0ABQ9F0H4_TEGGR|nr:hypothetical protein KUTeg_012694 [Tegillarca granosa]